MDPVRLTPLQFAISRAIAGAHGHLWAEVTRSWQVSSYTLDEIGEASLDASNMGRFCPRWYGQTVLDWTGTGRLLWKVAPDGRTKLTVRRPQGTCIRVVLEVCPVQEALWRVAEDGEPPLVVVEAHSVAPWQARHLDALSVALRALVDEDCCDHQLVLLQADLEAMQWDQAATLGDRCRT